jgi:hypothetical protein
LLLVGFSFTYLSKIHGHSNIKYLRIFGCRISRKIFGPVQNEDGFWRIRMNYELNDLIKKRRCGEICKKQKNGLAGSRDADGMKKNT